MVRTMTTKGMAMASPRKPSRKGGKAARLDIYKDVTDGIIAELEKCQASGGGVLPWKNMGTGIPVNGATGAAYTRINRLLLMLAIRRYGGADPRFCTFNQIKAKGWHLKDAKGQGIRLAFYKPYKTKGKDRVANDESDDPMDKIDRQLMGDGGDGKVVFLLRHFTVFHASLIEGIPPYELPPRNWDDTKASAHEILEGLKAQGMTYAELGNMASYSRGRDHLQMPPQAAFDSGDAYYATLAHEMGHATGHQNRLGRQFGEKFGDENYAKEELVAELTGAMTCAMLGIESGTGRHAEYIGEWLDVLRNDKTFIFKAAKSAQDATDYLLRLAPKPEYLLDATAENEVFDLGSFGDGDEDDSFDLNDVLGATGAAPQAQAEVAEDMLLAARQSPRPRG